MVSPNQYGTQVQVNGLLDQLGMSPVAGRLPRPQPLAPMAMPNAPMVSGRAPRLQPLVANRLPVGPQLPAPTALGNSLPGAYNPNVANLAGQVAGGVGNAAKVGRFAGAVTNPAATGLARYMAPGLGVKAIGGKLLGYGGAGLMASQLVNSLPGESNAEQGLQGAAIGAGIGATAGSIFPVVGTGLGALAGGLVGGAAGVLGNMFGGDDKDKFSFDKVANLMTESGVSTDQQTSLQGLYELEKEALGDEAAKANLLTRADSILQQQMLAEEQAQISAAEQQKMLASQALAGQFFAPFAQNMVQSAQQRYEMIQNVLPTLPENFRGVAAAQSAATLDNATRMATAYQAQSQLIPTMAAYESQQSQVNSLAQQLLQQGIQNTLTPQTTDLSALLQGG